MAIHDGLDLLNGFNHVKQTQQVQQCVVAVFQRVMKTENRRRVIGFFQIVFQPSPLFFSQQTRHFIREQKRIQQNQANGRFLDDDDVLAFDGLFLSGECLKALRKFSRLSWLPSAMKTGVFSVSGLSNFLRLA